MRWCAALLALAAAMAIWFWYEGAEERALAELPHSERRDVYTREIANLRALCEPLVEGDLSEHCRQQAEFILQLPECDAACQELARRQLRPMR